MIRTVLALLLFVIATPAQAREVVACGKTVDADSTSLTCWKNVPTAAELRRLPKLEALDLSYADGVTSLSFLAGAPQLERLDISRQPLRRLEPLARPTALRWLEMGHMTTKGLDLTSLGKLSALRCLHLEGTAAKGWSALQRLTAMRVLEAKFAQLIRRGVASEAARARVAVPSGHQDLPLGRPRHREQQPSRRNRAQHQRPHDAMAPGHVGLQRHPPRRRPLPGPVRPVPRQEKPCPARS